MEDNLLNSKKRSKNRSSGDAKSRKARISTKCVDLPVNNLINVNPTKSDSKIKSIKCDKCSYTARTNSRLLRHSKIHNPVLLESKGKLKCPEEGCELFANSLVQLDLHLQQSHARAMEVETFHFPDQQSLQVWMLDLQKNHFSKYLNKCTELRKTQKYYCNRSSQFKRNSRSTGKRNPRKHGSIRSDRICTSRILVQLTDTGLSVQYHKTHTGHKVEPEKLGVAIQPRKRNVGYNSRKKQQEYMDAGRKEAADYFTKALQLTTDCKSTDALVESMKTVLASMECYRKDGIESSTTPLVFCII